MIRLGLRLTLRGGREAATRLIMIVVAVAIGVGMLLAAMAGINAVNAQNSRYAWLETGSAPGPATPATSGSAADPLWWRIAEDRFADKTIVRVDVAATGPDSPVPPGIRRLPRPGEFYASPALTALLRATPPAELGARYGGRQVGTIGSAALPAPNSQIIVIGHTVEALERLGGATKVTRFETTAPSNCGGCAVGAGFNANGIDLVLGVVALAVLFPVLVFIGTATRLSAARREQRFAAMRLVGATPRQISVISAVESSVAASVGVALGFLLFLLIRAPLAGIPFTGAPFYTSDLSLNPADVITVALGVPIAAAVAARLALRRVQISPLGVTRRVTPRPPRAWRLIPLLAGIAELTWFLAVGRPKTTGGQAQAYFTGFLLIIAGLVVAGPWLTMIGSRLLARRAKRPAALIAGRRLADNPNAGFRAISGLVLALFVTSVAVGVITSIVAYSGGTASGSAGSDTLLKQFFTHPDAGQVSDSVPSLPAGLTTQLTSIAGVRGVSIIRADPHQPSDRIEPQGVVSCAQLARTPAVGQCAPGAAVAAIDTAFKTAFGQGSSTADQIWPAATITVDQLGALPVRAIVVATNGTTSAIESARTVLEAADSERFAPDTLRALTAKDSRLLTGYRQLANVVILVSLPIAGCSLAVSVAAGLSERKRPFSLLRLTGVPLAMLRRVVALETAVPLLVSAVVSVGIGFLAAHLFLRTQLDETLQPPGVQYYFIVLAGLVASLGIIASTLPLLDRITGPETARNE